VNPGKQEGGDANKIKNRRVLFSRYFVANDGRLLTPFGGTKPRVGTVRLDPFPPLGGGGFGGGEFSCRLGLLYYAF